ncbi:hypothetical protein BDB01DRAFT_784306 [Pilobolus umbonatus]|nr:hypothetical protein BDB01DRAFT_784306 [Pilobolus umbonatus]
MNRQGGYAFYDNGGGTEAIPTENGYLVLRPMEDDNSCLFRSIGYLISRDVTMATQLREVIANVIRDNPSDYSSAALGQPRDQYIQWIQKKDSWGGAIEIAIFSDHFGVEIDSIDVQTGRIDQFGKGKHQNRVLLLYSGIHYDALALAPTADSPTDFDTTWLSVEDASIDKAASEMARRLRQKHQYTDMANFTLKCEQCNTNLKGEKDAQEHAKTTGHTRFAEYQ